MEKISENHQEREQNVEQLEQIKPVLHGPYLPADLPVEADYKIIKNDPNAMWEKYEPEIRKIANRLGYRKNFDSDELYQQAYMYFIEFCAVYNPYYNNSFYPFDRFLFKNLIIRLRAFIQSYYFKRKREQPTELLDFMGVATHNTTQEAENKILVDYIYNQISPRQREILQLSCEGYKQQEIGDALNISQSRVSVIRKKTIKNIKNKLNKLENENK